MSQGKIQKLQVLTKRTSTIPFRNIPVNGICRGNGLRTYPSQFKLKASKNAAIPDVKLNGILPYPKLLVPSILIPIPRFHSTFLQFHHSSPSSLLDSITPVLQSSIQLLLFQSIVRARPTHRHRCVEGSVGDHGESC